MEPSSSTLGFFQPRPELKNQFYEDVALRRVLAQYFPPTTLASLAPSLSSFGAAVLEAPVLTWVTDAERHLPYLKTWDTFGRRRDELVTSEGWRALQAMGIREGMVAIAYEKREGAWSRMHQFVKYHLWTGSCAYVTCPSAMTDGAASLLSRHLSSPSLPPALRPVFASAFSRLISRDPAYAWTSGQWMTERPGGSDVSRTETAAVLSLSASHSLSTDGSPLGPWSLSGFKWFSSATDSDMAILLARTQTPSGNTEISAFFAPLRRMRPDAASKGDSELNGVAIQRLKSKLGTRALPTAELELRDMRAYLLGAEGQGVREIATILNITRVHNAVSAVGLWGRGLAVSRAFARVRVIGGTKLMDIYAHVATMAGLAVDYRAWMHLTFFTVLLLGISEQGFPSSTVVATLTASSPSLARLLPSAHDHDHDATAAAAQLLLRLLTPVAKGITAKVAIAGLSECLESLGGVGYLENDEMELNIARLLRDASVLSIWEGTTDIMAADMLRVLKGPHGAATLVALGAWLEKFGDEQARAPWLAWRVRIEATGLQELMVDGRKLMFALGRIVAGVLLIADADRDRDEVAQEIARRWVGQKRGTWQEKVRWDRRIVFGDERGDMEAKL